MLVCFSSGCWSLLCNIHLGTQLSALYLDSILPNFTLSSFLACSSFCLFRFLFIVRFVFVCCFCARFHFFMYRYIPLYLFRFCFLPLYFVFPLSAYLFVCLFVCLSFILSCLFFFLSFFPYFFLAAFLRVCLFHFLLPLVYIFECSRLLHLALLARARHGTLNQTVNHKL